MQFMVLRRVGHHWNWTELMTRLFIFTFVSLSLGNRFFKSYNNLYQWAYCLCFLPEVLWSSVLHLVISSILSLFCLWCEKMHSISILYIYWFLCEYVHWFEMFKICWSICLSMSVCVLILQTTVECFAHYISWITFYWIELNLLLLPFQL